MNHTKSRETKSTESQSKVLAQLELSLAQLIPRSFNILSKHLLKHDIKISCKERVNIKQIAKNMDKNNKYREPTKYITDNDNKITEQCHEEDLRNSEG